MAGGNRTRATGQSVATFLEGVTNAARREDARAVLDLMARVTGQQPAMWGPAMVGFGTYRYRYDSGREGEWFRVGLAPRAANLVVYLLTRPDNDAELLGRLGRHKSGGSCLYLTRLADVDLAVLEELVGGAWRANLAAYPE